MIVKIKKLSENAVVPKYSKKGDAAMDLTATSYEYKDGRHVYGTGLAFEIPSGYVGLVFPRSSICKYDMRLSNAVGVIDSNYRGEVKAVFENDKMSERQEYLFEEDVTVPLNTRFTDMIGDTARIVLAKKGEKGYKHSIYQVGERIAQILIIPYPEIELQEVDELGSTERGENGFGSSGK